MNAGELHRLARILREVAQLATANPGERPPAASDVAIVEDISEHPHSAISEIVARTGLAQSQVSRTVERLQERGVLVVERDPADGRRSLVDINPKIRAEEFAKRGARPISAALRERIPELDAGQRSRIEAAVEVLATELLGSPRRSHRSGSASVRTR